MLMGLFIGIGATLVQICLLGLAYGVGAEAERRKTKGEGE